MAKTSMATSIPSLPTFEPTTSPAIKSACASSATARRSRSRQSSNDAGGNAAHQSFANRWRPYLMFRIAVVGLIGLFATSDAFAQGKSKDANKFGWYGDLASAKAEA